MKYFHLPLHSRSVFSRIGVVPARQSLSLLVLFKGTAHLEPLLSAGFGAEVPVFFFLIFFVFFSAGMGP